jgi:hypothetical protein
MNWARIECDSVAWEGFEEGLANETTTDVRWLQARDPWIVEARHPAASVSPAHYHPFDVVYLYTGGSVSMAAEPGQVGAAIRSTSYRAGDLRFVKAGTVYGPETTGPDGSQFYTFTFGGRPSVAYACDDQKSAGTAALTPPGSDVWWRGRWDERDWTKISVGVDGTTRQVAGRILSTFGIHAAMIQLGPNEKLGSLSHDSDCILLPVVGSVEIGSEESYGQHCFRWTAGGECCGPIIGGPTGGVILLLSAFQAVASAL